MIKAPFKRKSTAVSNGKDSTKTVNGTTSPSSSSVNSTIDVCNGLENAANVYAEIDVNDFLRTKIDNNVDESPTNPDELNFIECFFNKNDSKNNFFDLSNDDDTSDQAIEATEKTVVVHDYINASATGIEATCDEFKHTGCESKMCDGKESKKRNEVAEQNWYDIDSNSSYLHMRPITDMSKANGNFEINASESSSNLKKNGLSVNLPTRTINALITTIKDKIIKPEEKPFSELDTSRNFSSSSSSIKNDDKISKLTSDDSNEKSNSTKFAKRLKSKLRTGFKFTFSKHERICPKCSKNWSEKPAKNTGVTLCNDVMENCCCPNENCNDHDHIDDSHYVNEHTYSELMDVSKHAFLWTRECLYHCHH